METISCILEEETKVFPRFLLLLAYSRHTITMSHIVMVYRLYALTVHCDFHSYVNDL